MLSLTLPSKFHSCAHYLYIIYTSVTIIFTEATPAEVAEELMRTCDADACLGGLVNFLKDKKRKMTIVESGEDVSPGAETTDGDDTTPGVELIPKAKKTKTNGLQDVFCLN